MTVLFKLECPNRSFIKSFFSIIYTILLINPAPVLRVIILQQHAILYVRLLKKDTQGGYLEQGHKYTALKLQKHASM